MPNLFALHTIHRNPTGKKIEVIEPESVFLASDEEDKDLSKLNAVREASAEDVAVAKAKGKYIGNDDDADEGKTETPAPKTGRGRKSEEV